MIVADFEYLKWTLSAMFESAEGHRNFSVLNKYTFRKKKNKVWPALNSDCTNQTKICCRHNFFVLNVLITVGE